MTRKDVEDFLVWLTLMLVVGLMLALIVFQPLYERDAFNRCTNSQATYWDAFWGELRIGDCRGR